MPLHCLAWEPGTFQSESLGSGLLIQKFRLCNAALCDFQILLESSHSQEDRTLQDEAVQGLEPRQDTQTPLEAGIAVTAPLRNTQSWGGTHTGQAEEQRIPGKLPREFMEPSYGTSDRPGLFLQPILWTPISFKLNSSLRLLRHQNPLPVT